MIRIEVPGIPRPQGSKKIWKGRLLEDNPNTKPWRATVSTFAVEHRPECGLISGPVLVRYCFRFPRPKKHYRTGKSAHLLRDDAPRFHSIKPDFDKLQRAVNDALSGVIWVDDCQVAAIGGEKIYHEHPGVVLEIEELRP